MSENSTSGRCDGRDHVHFLLNGSCPECGGEGYWVRGIPATWSDPPDAEEVPCEVCLGTGLAVLWGNWEKLS